MVLLERLIFAQVQKNLNSGAKFKFAAFGKLSDLVMLQGLTSDGLPDSNRICASKNLGVHAKMLVDSVEILTANERK